MEKTLNKKYVILVIIFSLVFGVSMGLGISVIAQEVKIDKIDSYKLEKKLDRILKPIDRKSDNFIELQAQLTKNKNLINELSK